MRADAEQPTGTLRMLLTTIRRNQWVLLDRTTAKTDTKFYPFTQSELAPRLEGVPFETPATRALDLEGKLPSQTVESDKIRLFTGNLQNIEEPWLPRKVLPDPHGSPVAIGIPRIPRESVEHGVASDGARDRVFTVSTDDSGEPFTGYVAKSPAPEDETLLGVHP